MSQRIGKIMAIIPARGGSKGLPGKNIMSLCGAPMIAHTIAAALESNYQIDTYVSTDDEKIRDVAVDFGATVPFLRPIELATDNATTSDVVLHFIKSIKDQYDTLVLLQPTSPNRTKKHIDDAIELYLTTNRPVASLCPADKSPHWMFWSDGNSLERVIANQDFLAQRQALPEAYALNGAIYIVSVDRFLREKQFVFDDSVPYFMGKQESVDIDTILDFKLAEMIMSQL